MAENNTLTSNLLLQRWTKFHLSCCQKCCLQLKKPSVSAGNKNCSLTWRVQHRVCIEPCGLNTQDWFVTKRQINIYTQTQTHEQKYYNVQTQTVDWRCLVARMPLIGSCWEFELPLALFSHQCKCTMTPPPFLSFSNVLVETQNQNDDFSNVWMHMSNPTTKFLHKIEWPNHMNSWESGLAFSLSFCWVSLQTIGDSSWQKHFSFFLFISQSLPFFGSLLLVLWGRRKLLWIVAASMTLYAAWLRCDHWRRRSFVESKFSPVQPFTQTTGSVFVFCHIILSREVSTIHVSEPLTDWITPLIQNETNNNRNWYSIECPKFGLQSLLYGFESNESFMFFLQILCSACILANVAIFCDYLCLVYECVFPSPVSPRQPLDRHCPAFLLIQFSIITWFVFVYVFLYFYLCICIFILVLEFIFVFGQALSRLHNSPS